MAFLLTDCVKEKPALRGKGISGGHESGEVGRNV